MRQEGEGCRRSDLSTSDLVNALTDPFVQTGVLAAAGALVTRVILRGRPVRRLVGQLTFFLALTILLLYHGIIPYEAGPPDASILQRVFLGIAKIIWWINAAWSLISLVRVFLTFELQPREGRLLQDLVVGIIYVGAFLSVVAYVFDAPVGTLIATSGAVAIILGLALQSTLSDLFSGIALNLARSYRDRRLAGAGQRHRRPGRRDQLASDPPSDQCQRPRRGAEQRSCQGPAHQPEQPGAQSWGDPSGALPADHDAVRHRRGDALGADQQRHDPDLPEPTVQVVALDGNAVELELSFRVGEIGRRQGQERNLRPDLPARQGGRPGAVAPPDAPAVATAALDADEPRGQHVTPRRVLDAIALFASLTDGEKDALAERMVRRTFRKGEVLAEQGAVLKSLMIVRSGVVAVICRDDGRVTELGHLAPGDFFGEGGLLTGSGEPGSIEAVTFVVAYEITQERLAS